MYIRRDGERKVRLELDDLSRFGNIMPSLFVAGVLRLNRRGGFTCLSIDLRFPHILFSFFSLFCPLPLQTTGCRNIRIRSAGPNLSPSRNAIPSVLSRHCQFARIFPGSSTVPPSKRRRCVVGPNSGSPRVESTRADVAI